jgi:leukotriene-A4 hydrolase
LVGIEKWDKFIPHYFTTFKERSLDSYEFKATLLECLALANKWQSLSEGKSDFKPSAKDIESFTSQQSYVFLEAVQGLPSPLSPSQVETMGKEYAYASSQNVELVSRFYVIALKAKAEKFYKDAAALAGRVGRMKFVRPMYKELLKVDAPLARETFEKSKDFYHPICRNMVEKMLEGKA